MKFIIGYSIIKTLCYEITYRLFLTYLPDIRVRISGDLLLEERGRAAQPKYVFCKILNIWLRSSCIIIKKRWRWSDNLIGWILEHTTSVEMKMIYLDVTRLIFVSQTDISWKNPPHTAIASLRWLYRLYLALEAKYFNWLSHKKQCTQDTHSSMVASLYTDGGFDFD